MKFKIYDYDNKKVEVEVPDKPIHHITVTILSGDETGIIYFKDGTTQSFDASDCRNTNCFDEEYIVRLVAVIQNLTSAQSEFGR